MKPASRLEARGSKPPCGWEKELESPEKRVPSNPKVQMLSLVLGVVAIYETPDTE